MKISMLYRSLISVLLIYYALPCIATSNILVLGDSLSAGYGLAQNESWVVLLNERLQADNLDYTAINGSVSGATTADGLSTLPKLLDTYKPTIVIVALGSNDGLRGLPIFVMKQNLTKIIKQAQDHAAKVLLVGFELPQNYGPAYSTTFREAFVDLKDKYNLKFVPFLLTGFATDLNYFQKDRLHPTAAAQSIILDNVWQHLKPML